MCFHFMPSISIILPVYNGEQYLEHTIISILQQTMHDFEVIAIDDCSIDKSAQILNDWALKDKRLHVIYNSHNLGVAETRNTGIASARGEYICFIDSDDTWEHNKLESQLAFMRQNNCDFSCTSYSMIDDTGQFIKTRMINKHQIFFEDLLKENYICCSSVMVKSEIAKQYRMDSNYKHEDYVYWLELLQTGNIGLVLNRQLTNYRLVKTSLSANKFLAAKGRWQVYRNYLRYGFFKSGWYFLSYALNGFKKYKT